jgi:hypothetical protein
MDHSDIFPVSRLAVHQAGPGCKIGKATPRAGAQVSYKQKALILDSLAKVKGKSFAVYCIQVFASAAHLKTDLQLIEMITALQDQIKDNSEVMKRVLGDQFEFIRDLRMG